MGGNMCKKLTSEIMFTPWNGSPRIFSNTDREYFIRANIINADHGIPKSDKLRLEVDPVRYQRIRDGFNFTLPFFGCVSVIAVALLSPGLLELTKRYTI